MLRKIAFTVLLLGMFDGLAAWERRSMDVTRCQDEGKSMLRCKKETEEENEYTFTMLLSPENFKAFNTFSPLQKTRAMDLADHERMKPNEAVEIVQGEN